MRHEQAQFMNTFESWKRCALKTGVILSIFAVFYIAYGSPLFQADEEVKESLRRRIEAGASGLPSMTIGNESIKTTKALPNFYLQRLFEPVWIGKVGFLSEARRMIDVILEAEKEGLNPRDYHIDKIISIVETVSKNNSAGRELNPDRLIDLELLLTDSYLLYGSHLVNGRVNPETYDPEWKIEHGETNVLEILKIAAATGRIRESLADLKPKHTRYIKLREARFKYQSIANNGGWPGIDSGPSMKEGDKDARIVQVRKRLEIEGYPSSSAPDDPTIYDRGLRQTVVEFQRHYGLEPDGIIGPATINAMNVPARHRVRQISLAMERWRWLPRNLGPKYIRVNIANFKLAVIENEESVLDMRVIVGRTYRQTPVFGGKMTYLVLSPYWNVPHNIAVNDKLPYIKKDPEYLIKNNMKVFTGRGADAKQLDPKSIDWAEVTGRNFNYWLRQDPGPGNALGKVKFMFPNKYNVYLHDTPSQELFDRAVGAFSSGCIRLAKPMELAEYLLKGNGQWSRKTILETVEKREEKTVQLKETIPVYLIYSTVLVNEDGSLDFRDDIYGRDKKLDEAMKEILPDSM
jgi:murein L,D-transpeptidase YcbB/YkuD